MRFICPLCGWVFWLCECQAGPFVEKRTLAGRPVRALGWHEPPLSELVRRLKYGEETFLAEWFGAWLARGIGAYPGRIHLVPVPLHEKKLAERGYNQASLVARAIAKRTRSRLVLDGIVRARETEAQARLQAREREENLAGAFRVTRQLASEQIVIVDDVVTTGSTADALATALEHSGGKVLGVLSITAARPKGS